MSVSLRVFLHGSVGVFKSSCLMLVRQYRPSFQVTFTNFCFPICIVVKVILDLGKVLLKKMLLLYLLLCSL